MEKEQIAFEKRVNLVTEILSERLSMTSAVELAKQIVKGAGKGGEFGDDFESWLNNRFLPNIVWLSSEDYARGITRALPQALVFARADFGSSKQRDLGQLWTDTARGLLGEIAVQRFFEEKFGVQIQQDTTLGRQLDEYISTDIRYVRETSGGYHETRINTSIKTGKFNARWLDEYSASKIAQISAFIFVRLGTSKDHFVAYLKDISFIKTKLFPKAIELGELTDETSSHLWNLIPEFELIPAYISGFLSRQDLVYPIHSVIAEVRGRSTRKIYIKRGVGIFTRDNLYSRPEFQNLDPEGKLRVFIEGIEREVDDKEHFYADTGSFCYSLEDWKRFIAEL